MAKNVKDTDTTTDADQAPEAEAAETEAPKGKDQAAKDTSDGGEASEGDQAESSLDHASKPRELTVQQFLRVSGTRPDQAAGFLRHAQRVLPGRHTMDTWKAAFTDFWTAPAR